MDPRKEALSLKEFPLPEEVEVSPTSIAILGNSIENLEREISKLNSRLVNLINDRTRRVNSAIKSGLMEDQNYKIIEVAKNGNRVCDPKKLEKLSPILWKTYKELYAEKARRDADDLIQKAKDNVETKVLLSIADDVFGKNDVNLCSQIPITISYEVRKK